jgi:hypothetical protein
MASTSSSAFVAEAKQLIKSINLSFSSAKNVSKEVQKTVKTGVDRVLTIIEELVEKSGQNNGNNIDSTLAAIIDNKLNSIEKENYELFKELKAIKTSKSYSSALRTGQQSIASVMETKKYPVLVTPNVSKTYHSCKSKEKTIKSIIDNNNKKSKNKKICVNFVKYVGKGGLVLNCVTENDSNDLIKCLSQNTSHFSSKIPTKRWPKLKIMNVNEDDVDEVLISKNVEIKDYFETNKSEKIEDNIKVRFKFRRQEKTGSNTWVLELKPKIFNLIKNKRRVFIGWHPCRTEEYLYIKRCYHRQRFGHISNECRERDNNPSCGVCAGNHNTNICSRLGQNVSIVKNNRENKLNPNRKQFNTRHTVFNKECECLQKVHQMLIQSTNYE